MKPFRAAACVIVAAMLVACGQTTAPAPDAEPPTQMADVDNCMTWPSREWSANIDNLPPAGRTIHVRGIVVFPRAGYTWTLTPMVDEPTTTPAAADALRLVLTPTGPTTPAAAVETPLPVNYDAPTAERYESVIIFCGRGPIATIDEVTETS
jgi:hypothetical protein